MYIRTLVAALLVVCSMTALGETRLALGGWSHHWWDSERITNETHNIVGIEHNGYSIGRFDNSYGRETYYVARNWRFKLGENWNLATSFGVNRGYRECFGDDGNGASFCPHGYVALEYDKYWIVPTIKVQPGVAVFSPEIKF